MLQNHLLRQSLGACQMDFCLLKNTAQIVIHFWKYDKLKKPCLISLITNVRIINVFRDKTLDLALFLNLVSYSNGDDLNIILLFCQRFQCYAMPSWIERVN